MYSYACLLSGAVPGLPDRGVTCPCIAPQDVGYAISIEIADPNHGPCLISYANDCLLSGAISRLPDRVATCPCVAPQDVGYAVAVEIIGPRKEPGNRSDGCPERRNEDRKSTRLNSSH